MEGSPQRDTGAPVLAMDVGGTHVSAMIVNFDADDSKPHRISRLPVDSAAARDQVLATWAQCGRDAAADLSIHVLQGVGIAMPGPFDYENGISLIQGLDKYAGLYGTDVRAQLRALMQLPSAMPIVFRNDATCFTLGEGWRGAASGFHRVIGITLGTGFGSTFLRNGEVADSGPDVPPGGFLYNVPFRENRHRPPRLACSPECNRFHPA